MFFQVVKHACSRMVSSHRLLRLCSLGGTLPLLGTLGLATVLGLASPSWGQIPYSDLHRPLTRKWTTRHGLPQNWIKAITQTPDGALWIGTGTGLARFDGVSFKTFDRIDHPQLPSVDIIDLNVDHDGALWIATSKGVVVSRRAGEFELAAAHLELPHPRFLKIDDYFWIADYKVGAFFLKNGTWLPAEKTNLSADGRSRHACAWSSGPNFWTEDPSVVASEEGAEPRPWIDNSFCGVDSRGVLYSWFENQKRLQSVQRFARSAGSGALTPLPPLSSPSPASTYLETRNGESWFGLATGLYRLQDESFQKIPVTDAEIPTLFEDAEGNLWAGTSGDGLVQVVRGTKFSVLTTQQGLADDEVWAALDTPEGHLYVATATGVTRFVDGKPEPLQVDGPKVPLPRFYSLAIDEHGNILAGGFTLYKVQGARLVPIPGWFQDEFPIVRSRILPRAGGTILAGAGRTLFEHRGGSMTVIPFTELERLQLRDLLLDRQGILWATTQGHGLFQDDGKGFRQVTAEPAKIKGLMEDESGDLWISSREQGIVHYDRQRFRRITSQNGLFDNTIHDIVDDGMDGFWLTSDRGIARVRKDDLRAVAAGTRARLQSQQVFGLADGLLSQECNSGFPGAKRLADGRLVFATMKGLAVIDPARMGINEHPPPVEIRAVVTSKGELPMPAPGMPLTLAPEDRYLTADFAAMTFVAPELTTFSYKLDGYDDEWVDAGTRRQASYTGIPPGAYSLRVRATNHDGIESAEEAVLDIELQPYFHETKLFVAAVAGAAVAVLWLAFRWWTGRRHEQELEALVAERTRNLEDEKLKTESQAEALAELNLLKDRFFANLSHELRTPLTLLVGPLEELAADPDNPRRPQDVRMARNARVLERRVDELLDLARLESGHFNLDCVDVDAYDFVRRRCAAFEPAARKKQIRLEVDALPRNPHQPRPRVWIDRHRMEKVLWNLLANALKFTPRGGDILISVELGNETLSIHVDDSGPGIPEEDLPYIFDRFYRSPQGRDAPGVGIGLALTHDLVSRHGGRISAENRVQGGARFILELRLGHEHLRAEDMNLLYEDGSGDASGFDLIGAATTPSGEQGATILVVEDDLDLRSWLVEVLSPHHLVLSADDGRQGLKIARKSVPDLILSDISMPNMDGFELVRALRSDAATDHVPIVFLSARGGGETRIAGFEDGIDAYLTKPINPRELLSRIDALLTARKRLQRRLGGTFTLEAGDVDVESADETFLRRVLEIVESRLSDPAFGAVELAEEIHLSRRQLHRKLTALTAESPASMIRRIRLERARSLLEQGAGSVSDVSARVGFAKSASFSESFTKTFGAPPSSFLPS